MRKVKLEKLLTPTHGDIVLLDEVWPIDEHGFVLIDESNRPEKYLPQTQNMNYVWVKLPVAYITQDKKDRVHGQIAYETYRRCCGNTSPICFHMLPSWVELSREAQDAWDAAVQAALTAEPLR